MLLVLSVACLRQELTTIHRILITETRTLSRRISAIRATVQTAVQTAVQMTVQMTVQTAVQMAVQMRRTILAVPTAVHIINKGENYERIF